MEKPVVFFSHSSKDASMILIIKNKLNDITGGVLDIFQSSDGQSIPFGHNWVHKIEDGLKKASVMFVFVTPNSISSNWIYFEAGFAYSKGIAVVPVALGVDIALLKAPLNLLQGFNISSNDGLNNFISIINEKYNYHFTPNFTGNDYINTIRKLDSNLSSFDLKDIFHIILYRIDKIDNLFDTLKKYFIDNAISYSFKTNAFYKESNKIFYNFLIYGMRINSSSENIDITISPYNIKKTLPLFLNIVKLFPQDKNIILSFRLKSEYKFLTVIEDIAAILSGLPDEFYIDPENYGSFIHKQSGLSFLIYDTKEYQSRFSSPNINEQIMEILFSLETLNYYCIQSLIESLWVNGVIYSIIG